MSTRRTPALPPVHHLDGSSFVAATRRQALAGILAPDASSPQQFHGESNGCRMRTSCQSQYGSACFCADTSAEPAGTRHGRAPISRRLRLSWPPSPPNKIPPRLARGEENKCFFPDPPFSLGNTRVQGEDRGFLHALGRAAISSRPNRTS